MEGGGGWEGCGTPPKSYILLRYVFLKQTNYHIEVVWSELIVKIVSFKNILSPSFTVNSSYPYKTTGLEKPQRPNTDAVTQNQSLKESTESGSPSIGPFSISTVVNITIVLISVFVISFLMYGLSYLRKVFISRKNKKLDLQYTTNNNSMYECVEFPHHMWIGYLIKKRKNLERPIPGDLIRGRNQELYFVINRYPLYNFSF